LLLEVLVCENPSDMQQAIQHSTSVQNQFIDYPEFLFWRGRIFIYNGQTDLGKKHIK